MQKRETAVLLLMLAVILAAAFAGPGRGSAGKASAEPIQSYAATTTPTPTVTPTPQPTLLGISASYSKGSQLIGTVISKEDITVTAYYSDGSSEEVTDYSLSTTVVAKDGSNSIVVGYKTVIGYLNITGKTLTSIYASSSRYSFTLTNGPDERDITLTATYSDGSTAAISSGYTIIPSTLSTVGSQNITIVYQGLTCTVPVYGNEMKTLTALTAYYDGTLSQNESVSRSKLTVTAVFTDSNNNSSQERITSYAIATPSFANTGEATIKVTYLGKEASCKVTVTARVLESLTAKYDGPDIEVGSEYNEDDLYVYATYSDGNTERVTDYRITSRKIKYIGENTVTVTYGGITASATIYGVEAKEADFTYVSSCTITSRKLTATVITALPSALDTDAVAVTRLTTTNMKKIRRKLGSSGEYMGFKYVFANDDSEIYLPVQVRVELPAGFEAQYTDIYYSSNLKSILGQLNKTEVDDSTLEVTVYKTGYYIVVYDPSAYEEEEAEEEVDD